jgi:hypothetical protein
MATLLPLAALPVVWAFLDGGSRSDPFDWKGGWVGVGGDNRIAAIGGVVAMLLALAAAGVLAQATPPPDDADPDERGVSGAVLGALAPVAAPGYRLQMTELVWAPGAYATEHSHPLAQIACVQSGALGMTLQEGQATVLRGGGGPQPAATEPMALDAEVILEPRDCVAYDEFAAHTVHTVWNASEEATVIWTADLVEQDEPYTTYVGASGTPVP